MTWRGWQLLVVCLVAALVAAASSMIYANRVAAESERQWCGVIVTMDDAYRRQPPPTEVGRKFAADIAKLRRDFGCPPHR